MLSVLSELAPPLPCLHRPPRTALTPALCSADARCWGDICKGRPEPEGDWRDAWAALEQARAAGTVRAIGVSNFHPPVLR
eukprot:COSAG04_NODE_2750_length_3641_cov_2.359684_3_plen_80_part_00